MDEQQYCFVVVELMVVVVDDVMKLMKAFDEAIEKIQIIIKVNTIIKIPG